MCISQQMNNSSKISFFIELPKEHLTKIRQIPDKYTFTIKIDQIGSP